MWGPEPPLTLSTRDRSGAATGYREWTVVETDDGPRLRSLWSDTVWTPGAFVEAACRPPSGFINAWAWRTAQQKFPHRFAPDPRCRCGTSGRIRRAARRRADLGVPVLEVQGVVRGWGLVVASPASWRAQHAEPVALIRGWIPDELTERLARAYRVPLV